MKNYSLVYTIWLKPESNIWMKIYQMMCGNAEQWSRITRVAQEMASSPGMQKPFNMSIDVFSYEGLFKND